MAWQRDFVEILDREMSLKIFSYLEEPTDIARLCVVSKNWYRFVIENQVCKQFCLKKFPELSKMIDVVEVPSIPERVDNSSDMLGLSRSLVRNHRVFSFLACFSKLYEGMYLIDARRNDEHEEKRGAECWEKWCHIRKGYSTVLDTAIYELVHTLCLISEIRIMTSPEEPIDRIHLPRSVRFSFGFQKSLPESPASHRLNDDLFVWTYRSQEFPVTAEKTEFKKYRLPRPVVSIGGIVKMELLGGVHQSNLGACYYLRVSDNGFLGFSPIPLLDVNIVDNAGGFILRWSLAEAYVERMQDMKAYLRSPRDEAPVLIIPRFLGGL